MIKIDLLEFLNFGMHFAMPEVVEMFSARMPKHDKLKLLRS